MAVDAVVFDFGGTLVDEERTWRAICAQYGWSEMEFFAALGAVIERRGHHTDVLRMMGAADPPEEVAFDPGDFYDDALPALRAVRRTGARVGIAGNMSVAVERFLAEHVDVDFIASSMSWGIEKPDPEFFARVVDACGCDAARVVYVGDRIDNDVLPALAAGMQSFWIRRGAWAVVQAEWPEASSVGDYGTSLTSIFSGGW